MSGIAIVAAALDGDCDALRRHPYDPADPFWRTAEEHRVDLLLLDQARAGGLSEPWSAEVRERARRAAVDACAIRSLRDGELRRVLDVLGSHGLSCLILKGAALAHTIYRQPHLRPRSDADLLVRAADAERVARVLEVQGYARAVEVSGAFVTSQMHFDRPGSPDARYALDIHWRAVNTHAFAGPAPFDDLEAARVAVPALGAHAWTLSRPHALALACIHRVAHHGACDDLLWLWDVRQLAAALSESEAELFASAAASSATRAVCAHTLEAAARVFTVPAAAALADRVRPGRGDRSEPSADFLDRRMNQADILRSDVANVGWRRGATLIREHLFPAAPYMHTRYAGWPRVLLPVAYLHRIVSGAPKWLRRS